MALFKRRPLRLRTQYAKRNLLLRSILTLGVAAILGGLIYGIYAITRISAFTISEIEVDGGTTVSAQMVREAVNKELEGNYFFLIPKRFTYAYPYKKVLQSVVAIPRIAHVEVSRTSKTKIHILFEEHAPYALWCHSVETSSCVFLAESGYAFAQAPSLKGSAFIRYIVEGRDPTPGTQVLEEERLRAMEVFMEGLKTEFGFRVYEVTLTADDDVIYHLEKGSSILVTRAMDVQEAFDNLHSVLESSEFTGLVPGQFDYIDLRFGNRVFVKEDFETPVDESATSTPLQ